MSRLVLKSIVWLSVLICLVSFTWPGLTVAAAPATMPYMAGSWWDEQWDYRVPITVSANGVDRTAKPVEIAMNFTSLLTSAGSGGAFDPNSLRVIEVDSGGTIQNTNVPFQFDQDSAYNATTNAAGTLTFMMTGTTTSSSTRYYHLYFDIVGKGFTLPSFTAQVTLTDNIMDEGQSSYRIQTQSGTYYYQKQGAAFSSLVDSAGNDWIGYNATVGPGGSYRGIPNMIYPEGKFHPGNTSSTSNIVTQGPLKVTIHSVTNDNQWEALWEIFPTYARMTLLKKGHDYWFLYEGTPGGHLDDTNDLVVRADGTTTTAATTWTGDISGAEWSYFADQTNGRALFVAHHEDDSAVDSYFPLADETGAMTVFGFGRDGVTAHMSATPAHFTIGLLATTQFTTAAPAVNGAYRDLAVQVGAVDGIDSTPPVISNVVCIPGPTYATIAWETDELTTGVVSYGSSQSYGSTQSDPTFQRIHALKLLGLNPASPLHFRVSASDLGANTAVTNDILCAPLGNSSIQSDDFNRCTLNTTRWSYIDPQSTTSATTLHATGTDLSLAVPGGVSHDIWRSGNLAPRIMQPANNNDFTIDVKFNSSVTATYQMQGLLVEQDSDDLLRVNVQYDSGQIHLLAIKLVAGEPTIAVDQILPSGTAPIYLRLNRAGITWQLAYSYNGTDWTTDSNYRFTHIMTVTAVGAFAGNAGAAPAHTALIDYFFNTTAPITPEDATGLVLQPVQVTPAGAGSASGHPVTSTPGNPTCGSPVQLSATPQPGWLFAGWQSSENSVSGAENPKVTTFKVGETITAHFVQEQYTLKVNKIGGGSVNYSPRKTTYVYGDLVTVNAIPDAGWSFAGWSGAVSGTVPTQTVSIMENTTLTATFSQLHYFVQSMVAGEGTVQVDPKQPDYTNGQHLTITAVPTAGWQFAGWVGTLSGQPNPASVTMTGDLVAEAHFSRIPYAVTTAVNGEGQVTVTPAQGVYFFGDTVTFHAEPATGWRFVHWTGDISGTTANQTIQISAPISATAIFTNHLYSIATAVVGQGAVVLTPTQESYLYQDLVTVAAVPAAGWVFEGWQGTVTGQSTPTELQVTDNATITALFRQLFYTVTVTVADSDNTTQGGIVEFDPPGPYVYGQQVVLHAVPAMGYAFAGWDEVGSESLRKARLPDPTLTITVTEDQQYVANFVADRKLYLPMVASDNNGN